MNNVASLELSKKLHELSGWKYEEPGFNFWTVTKNNDGEEVPRLMHSQQKIMPDWGRIPTFPAYDCGFLLSKLPNTIKHSVTGEKIALALQPIGEEWQADYEWSTQPLSRADTPEDALCTLAIKLFEEGILKNE